MLDVHMYGGARLACTPVSGVDGDEVLYGTQNGKMGLVKLEAHEPTYRWDMLNERRYGGVTSITTCDLTGGLTQLSDCV